MENLSKYFANVKGSGVLATSDGEGKVDAAVYVPPQFTDETTAVFIMGSKLSHSNISQNPNAVYLFMEEGKPYVGKRLLLVKTKETADKEAIKKFVSETGCSVFLDIEKDPCFMVSFKVESVRPLLGDKD